MVAGPRRSMHPLTFILTQPLRPKVIRLGGAGRQKRCERSALATPADLQ